jgi:hypothetical protein
MVPSVSAGSHKGFPEKYSDIYMPVSLAVGTVRTPEFPAILEVYDIIIQADRSLPVNQMMCMMGATSNPFELKECSGDDPLLRADWTVWNDGHIVAHGSSARSGGSSIAKDQIWKFIGSFAGEAGKKYVVEAKFTKDGTSVDRYPTQKVLVRMRPPSGAALLHLRLPSAASVQRAKSAMLTHGQGVDTSPPAGCCRATCGCYIAT